MKTKMLVLFSLSLVSCTIFENGPYSMEIFFNKDYCNIKMNGIEINNEFYIESTTPEEITLEVIPTGFERSYFCSWILQTKSNVFGSLYKYYYDRKINVSLDRNFNQVYLSFVNESNVIIDYKPEDNNGKIIFFSNHNGKVDIYTMNFDGTEKQNVTNGKYNLDNNIVFNKENNKYCFLSDKKIVIFNPIENNEEVLFDLDSITQLHGWKISENFKKLVILYDNSINDLFIIYDINEKKEVDCVKRSINLYNDDFALTNDILYYSDLNDDNYRNDIIEYNMNSKAKNRILVKNPITKLLLINNGILLNVSYEKEAYFYSFSELKEVKTDIESRSIWYWDDNELIYSDIYAIFIEKNNEVYSLERNVKKCMKVKNSENILLSMDNNICVDTYIYNYTLKTLLCLSDVW
jgi:hypothetical protein